MAAQLSLLILTALLSLSARATIYGGDDRIPVDFNLPLGIQNEADAVAGRMMARDLHAQEDGLLHVAAASLGRSLGLCSDERFYNEPTAASCTAFMISPTRMVTAGHCLVSENFCHQTAWVFDYRLDRSGWDGRTVAFDPAQVYYCRKVIALSHSETLDYAVFELDRPIKGRTPLTVDDNPVLRNGAPLYGLGFPSGLPMKWNSSGSLRASDGPWLTAEIDTFDYNSGTPIFSAASDKVVGILIDGDEDYAFNNKRQCSEAVRCKSNDCKGETFISSQVIAPYAHEEMVDLNQNQNSPAADASNPYMGADWLINTSARPSTSTENISSK